LIFEAAGLDPVLLATNEREYRTPARRPRYSALSNAKMERSGLAPMPPLREVLVTYFARRPGQASKKTPQRGDAETRR
jgi:dTDP-4-dehydrorhamnose reductase